MSLPPRVELEQGSETRHVEPSACPNFSLQRTDTSNGGHSSMPAQSARRILRAAAAPNDKGLLERIRALAVTKTSWSDTLALPKSPFPARPSAEQIGEYRRRCADDLYAWQRAHRPKTKTIDGSGSGSGSGSVVAQSEVNNEFVLHDGPPYANGAVHVGHALNKILKDLMVRSELARGRRVQYTPGWDCHGLPIELKALQQPTSPPREAKKSKDAPKQEAKTADEAARRMTAPQIRAAARELARSTIEVQKKSFREWGVMGEWDEPYTTMDKEFEMRQLGVFREMVRKGLISRHHRPVYWSPSSRTALAEAELEYDDNHKCTAAFVRMPFVSLPEVLRANSKVRPHNLSALIWTTTPWTLPANKAIAVKDDIEYCVVEISSALELDQQPDQLLVAKDRIEHIMTFLPDQSKVHTILESIPGSLLADGNAKCFNLFSASESPILQADFVTAGSGTGLVHMAPGHGMEDYQVCQQNGVGPAFAPVDDEGRFTGEAFPGANDNVPSLSGLDAQTKGVRAVLDVLRTPQRFMPVDVHTSNNSLVFAEHNFTHKNPIDWRTKKPVIVRATAQWFADTSAIKDRAIAALEDVKFIPESGKTRLRSFVEGRSQWCISRQRAWGVPIPALYHVDTGEACITDDSINHIISIIEQKGIDAWFSDALEDPVWLHSSLKPGKWIRGKDTMDVWFDSGTSWTSLERRDANSHVSDVYSEGTDQHRGWFQSSLLTAIATQDSNEKPLAPFRLLSTHGFTLDGEGKKMSKSLGNVVSPEEIISGSLVQAPRGKNRKGQQKQAPIPKAQKGSLGPDVLRLWVASSDYTRDVSISQPVLQSVQQALQKYRVTFKFLLGVLHDYPLPFPQQDLLEQLDFADQLVLHRLSKCSATVYQAYLDYRFYAGINEINKFVNNDLSAFYFEIIKDRLYAGSMAARRHTQTVLVYILQELTKMLGPATPHLVEEVWEWMPPAMKSNEGSSETSLHPLQQIWEGPFQAQAPGLQESAELGTAFDAFRKISAAVKVAQEEARTARLLGSGLACRVEIHLPNHINSSRPGFNWLKNTELAELLVVSQAEVLPLGSDEADDRVAAEFGDAPTWRYEQPLELMFAGETVVGKVAVLPPLGEKCPRCWKFTADEEKVPCAPCREVLAESL